MGNYKKYTYFLDNFSPSAMLTRFVGLNFFAVCYDCHTRWLYLNRNFSDAIAYSDFVSPEIMR
jgi:hypothetical protein